MKRIPSAYPIACVAGTILLLAAPSAIEAAVIQYNFEGNTAEATTNDLDSLGVTAGDIQTSETHGGNTGIDNDRWQRKLQGGSPSTMSFIITIPSGVIIDITQLSFVFGMDSRQGTNDTWGGWDLTISQDGVELAGSASPASSGAVFLEGTSSNDFFQDDYTVNLTGLTGLTDTEIEFAFEMNYATASNFTGGNNNSRHAFLDDVTVTSTVIPEPATALLGGLGFLIMLRRRR